VVLAVAHPNPLSSASFYLPSQSSLADSRCNLHATYKALRPHFPSSIFFFSYRCKRLSHTHDSHDKAQTTASLEAIVLTERNSKAGPNHSHASRGPFLPGGASEPEMLGRASGETAFTLQMFRRPRDWAKASEQEGGLRARPLALGHRRTDVPGRETFFRPVVQRGQARSGCSTRMMKDKMRNKHQALQAAARGRGELVDAVYVAVAAGPAHVSRAAARGGE